MAVCVISGTVKTAAGSAVQNALTRLRLLLPPVSSASVAMQVATVDAWTDQYGAFSLTGTQGATARLEISSCGIDVYGKIPSESTATLETILAAWEDWET